MADQGNNGKKGNPDDNRLFYGIVFTAAAILFLTWMKEDSFTFWGLFTVHCKPLGIALAVLGGWNLLTSEGFGDLVGVILTLPFQLLGWLLEHWYLVIAVIALVFWLDSRQEAKSAPKEEARQEVRQEAVMDEPIWSVEVPTETEWVPPATTMPPAKVYIQQPYAGMHREAGVCRNLREDAMILLVFVNDSTSIWTQQEIQNYLGNNIHPALEFIEYRASEYGWSIDLESCVYPDDNGDTALMYHTGTVPSWAPGMTGPAEMLTMAAEAYGFASTDDMIENVRNYAGTDQVGVVFCLDKEGRSYAYWHDTDPDFVEYSVVFTRQNGAATRASMVAHEVLHLFGGDDMYSEGTDRVNRAALARKLHPREVFYEQSWNLYDNVVGGYTAYAVGWLNALPAQYDCPEWWS